MKSYVLLRPRWFCFLCVCCAFAFFFFQGTHTLAYWHWPAFPPPLIGAASVEAQLSNREKPSLHLVPDWCGTCSTPPDLQLTDYKSHAIHSAGADFWLRLPPPSCSTFWDCNNERCSSVAPGTWPFCLIAIWLRFWFYHNCGAGSGILRSKIQICLFS